MSTMLWKVGFSPQPLIPGMPYPHVIAGQIIDNDSYYFEGKNRGESDWYLFEYSCRGRGMFWDENGRYDIPESTGFLCRINDPDTGYCYPSENREPWEIIFVSFYAVTSIIQTILDRFGPVFRIDTDSALIQRFLQYKKQDNTTLEITAGEGILFVDTLLAACMDAEAEQSADTAYSFIVREARSLIRSHRGTNLYVSELADMLNITPEHLCRVFRSETGMTPLSYITREKMRYACELLQDPSLSCKEICAELEYDNASHFARTFRKVTGMNPTEFRRKGTAPFI